MKDQNEKAMKKGARSYFYAVLGCIAVLLAAAIVITAVAVSQSKQEVATTPDPVPVTPSDPVDPDEPVVKEEGFFAPVSSLDSLNSYGFYYNKTLNVYHLHKGVDFSAEAGEEVFASDDGVVEEAYGSDVLCGGRIVIKHENGVRTVYEYVDVADGIEVGDSVTRGQAIGTVAAATGSEYKDGAHLHFEIIENGESVDPAKYLTFEEK